MTFKLNRILGKNKKGRGGGSYGDSLPRHLLPGHFRNIVTPGWLGHLSASSPSTSAVAQNKQLRRPIIAKARVRSCWAGSAEGERRGWGRADFELGHNLKGDKWRKDKGAVQMTPRPRLVLFSILAFVFNTYWINRIGQSERGSSYCAMALMETEPPIKSVFSRNIQV